MVLVIVNAPLRWAIYPARRCTLCDSWVHPPRHDFIHYTPTGTFGDGKMTRVGFSEQKHGAVIHITKKEAKMLEKLWNKKK